MEQKNGHPVRYAAERLGMRLLMFAAFVVCITLLVPRVWDTLSPFIVAFPIAAMLQPLIRFFQQKLHFRRGLAVAFWVLLVCIVAFVLIYWFISFAVEQVVSASNNMPAIVGSITSVLQTAIDKILGLAEDMPETIRTAITDSVNTAFKWFSDQATDLAGTAINYLLSFAASLPYAFIYLNFLVLAIAFISSRYANIRAFFRRGDSSTTNSANMGMLRKSAGKGAIGYIRVQLLFFVIILLMSWTYFQVLGFPYAVLIAMLAALLELIPQFGCGTLYLPWAAICFIIGDSRAGWLVLGLYGVYSLLRRLIEPSILGTNLGMSPLLSLIGMFAGMQLGGVIGLILGPIAMVIIVSAVRAHFFDDMFKDIHTTVDYLRARWNRGREEQKDGA